MENKELIKQLAQEYNFPESFEPYLDSLIWQVSFKPILFSEPKGMVLRKICDVVSKYDLKKEALKLFDDAVSKSKNLSLDDLTSLCEEEDKITSKKIKRTIGGLKTRIDEYLIKCFSSPSGNRGVSEKFSPDYSDLKYHGT